MTSRSSALAAAVALCIAAPLSAQSLQSSRLARDTSAAVAGPALGATTVALRTDDAPSTPAAPASANVAMARSGQSTTLMIVGGGAFLAGALIGGNAGTVFMVGGALVGLYGLYTYLEANPAQGAIVERNAARAESQRAAVTVP